MSLDQLHLPPPEQQQAILNGPGLSPPAGVTPNLDNPANGNVLCIVIATFLLAVATPAFLLGIYVKLSYFKRFNLEDYLAFAGSVSLLLPSDLPFCFPKEFTTGQVFDIAQVYCLLSGVAGVGGFVHQWDIRVKDLAGFFYLIDIGSIFYAICIVLLKVALLFEWIRIFVPGATRGTFFWICHAVIWTNVLFYTAIIIVENLSCKPYARLWDKTLSGTCYDTDTFNVATASLNLASDILILFLPQRIIWRLQLKTQKKIGVAVIFAIGISACVSAAYRLYASSQYLQNGDRTYITAGVALGSEAEAVCAILVFYVPTLPKALKDGDSPLKLLSSIFMRLKSLAKISPVGLYQQRRDQGWEDGDSELIRLQGSRQSDGYQGRK